MQIVTGPGNDNIVGTECSDTIRPGGGNDFVDGNGPDVLICASRTTSWRSGRSSISASLVPSVDECFCRVIWSI